VNKPALLVAIILSLLLPAARSQAPKPLTEGDLFKSIDQLNSEPLTPKPVLEPTAPKKDKTEGQTEITADAAEFNNKTHIAIFIGHVIVKNPEFNVVCDKLTAYLKHDDTPAAADKKPVSPATPKPIDPAKPADPATPTPKKGGLERAIAEMQDGGKVIITQDKKEADGTITHSIAKSERANYNAITGEITLTGWPDVKQGVNSSIAVEEGTVMIMTRDGKMRTEKGRTRFLIQDTGNDKPDKSPAH
jgi:lipopolysaccharide export system protein LptA